MRRASLPYRYAQALLQLADAEGKVDDIGDELTRFAQICRDSTDFFDFLTSETATRDSRRSALEAVLAKLKASELFQRFCHRLLERDRWFHLQAMDVAYNDLRDQLKNIVRASVYSATPLSKEQSAKVEKIIADKTGKEVALEFLTDPELIGGFRVQIGSRLYDGSVQGELQRAQEHLLQKAIS